MALMLAREEDRPYEQCRVLWAYAALQIVLGCARAYGADPTNCIAWVAKIVGVQGQVDTRRAGELLLATNVDRAHRRREGRQAKSATFPHSDSSRICVGLRSHAL